MHSDFNALFIDKINTEGLTKAAALQTDIVRQKVWEESFIPKLITVKDVTRDDRQIQEDIKTDTIYYLDHVETVSTAMSCAIRGNAYSQIWRAKKYPITFHKVETEHIVTDELTILSIPYPFVKDMEKKFSIWLGMVQDRAFILNVEACVQQVQYWENGNAYVEFSTSALKSGNPPKQKAVRKSELALAETTNNFKITTVQRRDFADLAALFPGNAGESLIGQVILITETDFQGFNTWEYATVGEGAWKVTQDGYTANTIIGYKFVRTNKTSILRPGNIYMFAPKEFGGKFLRLKDITVCLERYGDRLETWAWAAYGMGFANLRSVKKLELYSGSVTPEHKTSGYAIVEPMSEEEIVSDVVTPEVPNGYVPQVF